MNAAAPGEAVSAMDRPAGFPSTVLALVDRGAPDDSVAYVGALLERALTELASHSHTITVFPDQEGRADPTLVQRGLFAVRLMRASRRADCVLFNHVGVATAQSGIPSSMRRPYAVFLHGPEAWDEQMDVDRRRALAGASLCIANSQHTARRVEETHAGLRSVDICPVALLPDRDASPVDGALVASITQRTVVISGPMMSAERSKGHDELLDAWPAVLGRRPDARLALVGRGDDVKRLEAKANGLGLAGSVRFTGLVTESTLDAMLVRAGGFALPGRAEGSGLAYLRAMRAGVPCIAGADDAAREVVEDGKTGVLVPHGDRDALAQAVIALLGDSQRRRAMGDAGRARFEEQFTFANFRERLDSVLRRAFPARGAH